MRPNIDIPNQTDGAVADVADDRDQSKQEAYTDLINHSLDFQPLSEEAKTALIDYVTEDYFGGTDREQAEHLVENGYVTMIKDYTPMSPGYTGDLIFVIFGYPETHTLYTYEDGEITGEIDREAQN